MPDMTLSSESVLKNIWHSICHSRVELEFPKIEWKYKWSCNDASAGRLYNAITILRPKVIVETGTFGALGTFAMAKAAYDSNIEAYIYTIDYDGDPTTVLEQEEWLQLKTIRTQNLDLIRREFPGVTITFIEGDSRKVLPQLFERELDHWDFFYQDSMHDMAGILAEWNIMDKFAKIGSTVVFDDVTLRNSKAKVILKQILGINNQFTEYFFWNEVIKGVWASESVADDHPQFWAQKMR
jgi:predicted O-methyltransferase YrrM